MKCQMIAVNWCIVANTLLPLTLKVMWLFCNTLFHVYLAIEVMHIQIEQCIVHKGIY